MVELEAKWARIVTKVTDVVGETPGLGLPNLGLVLDCEFEGEGGDWGGRGGLLGVHQNTPSISNTTYSPPATTMYTASQQPPYDLERLIGWCT